MGFTYVDLFAGIGGFHAAMSSLGGECAYAVEIDPAAAKVYEINWGINPLGDITKDVTEHKVEVPSHDVLVAGFPCQPFSKSGAQRGMEETRGTLYWNILKVIEKRKPALIVLENVRNLAGPRHKHEWDVIIRTLREQGYQVSDAPAVFSPHLLSPSYGGSPQIRERVFIVAARNPKRFKNLEIESKPVVTNQPIYGWDPQKWNLETHLKFENNESVRECGLSQREIFWLEAWNDFVTGMSKRLKKGYLPGFPLWGDEWRLTKNLRISKGTPKWKCDILRKNAAFYTEHKTFIDAWAKKWSFFSDAFPPSRRKFEWQAKDSKSLWDTVIQLRPSGVRVKKPNYLPALVAITQTSIIGNRKRRLSVKEASQLQGFPNWFEFGNQNKAASFKQLGNGVSVGVVWYVMKKAVEQYENLLLETCPDLVESVTNSPRNPNTALKKMKLKVNTKKDLAQKSSKTKNRVLIPKSTLKATA